MTFTLQAVAVAFALMLLSGFGSDTAFAKAQQLSPAQQKCLNGYNSCRSPCFGKRNPGPCWAVCKTQYRQCKRQAR
ncbi:hypothetical protein A7A08_02954 [Methyloligella halotolerans]|uniref:Uncharacterized protein n=1 Tax=Methyloligella halotolerans TaxID=1177755 RepID=A0A1E2RV60_9HYPH|nr:hypothetical protein [Methyloligella halotolerans]ODA66101.1 hypothetical protein A7A08_02954 [Methyloligella halotolerans]